MSSSFLASSSSSASSHLSYLIPRQPPPPPMAAMGVQGCYGANGVVGVVGGAPASGVEAVNVAAAARQGGRPPLPRPPPRQCPRCASANTKFCYYNNYSRTQPRYLCRACRRHWTEGGTLRDVPVGGGRKNRRGGKAKGGGGSPSAAASASTTVDAQLGASGGGDGADAFFFPDILRQMLFQPGGTDAGGGGYSIDLGAWQQMGAYTAAPSQVAGDDISAAPPAEANCGGVQYWSGWLHDDVPGLDGAC